VNTFQKVIKRSFDIIFSLIGILFFLIPFIFIALIIKLTSQGPLFYMQKRVGWFGKSFTIIKFRSMYVGADKVGSITTATDSSVLVHRET